MNTQRLLLALVGLWSMILLSACALVLPNGDIVEIPLNAQEMTTAPSQEMPARRWRRQRQRFSPRTTRLQLKRRSRSDSHCYPWRTATPSAHAVSLLKSLLPSPS